MKLNLKYTAKKVDEIEQSKGLPIENCIADATINNFALFLQKGLVDDNGQHGVSREVAMSTIENYLAEADKDDLMMEIMEALISGGFLSRSVDLEKIRELKKKRQEELKTELDKI